MGRLMAMPKFYTANKPYGQTSAKIFILQICRLGRLMPNFYTSNIVYVAHCLYYLPFII